ncbi:olfactory receptor 1019-like [Gopherus flavomarginatus]|uniref:olfactory receptor 1019-like n=1 Tax=Gopherus flavomarginatus TaxID=286002 RepID=UPI0021CC2CB2|nr:olfactory receptor 1019-like [Gopherus flavomarginatus]
MAERNYTAVTEFVLLGFTQNPKLQVILLLMFLLIYILILVGNLTLVTLIRTDSQLHTPMYFFISNLALLNVSYATIITSSILITLVSVRKVILFSGCALQFFFLCIALSCECYLLGVMAYDRFMAICNPLLYTVIMSKWFCVLLVLGSYLVSCVNAVVQTIFIFHLSFCNSNIINHFFCDVSPILKLSCSDTRITDIVHFTCATVVVTPTILIILISYIYIIVTILRINSAKGQRKAFSTCTSHLAAITIFYGTGSFMYLRPSSKYLMDHDKIISLFYTLVIPMLNPLIYSLRNMEVKKAFTRMLHRKIYSQ